MASKRDHIRLQRSFRYEDGLRCLMTPAPYSESSGPRSRNRSDYPHLCPEGILGQAATKLELGGESSALDGVVPRSRDMGGLEATKSDAFASPADVPCAIRDSRRMFGA